MSEVSEDFKNKSVEELKQVIASFEYMANGAYWEYANEFAKSIKDVEAVIAEKEKAENIAWAENQEVIVWQEVKEEVAEKAVSDKEFFNEHFKIISVF